MATGSAAQASAPNVVGRSAQEEDEHRLQQYKKIVEFHDAIVAGKHPTLRVPATRSHTTIYTSQVPVGDGYEPSLNQDAIGTGARTSNAIPASAQAPQAGLPATGAVVAQRPSQNRTTATERSEINPILLEKSEELVRAEIQLERQRLERALKDDVDKNRVQKHSQAEALADFDLSTVLAKALTLTLAQNSVPLPANDSLTANTEAASDSFDDNTFYSSRHDTPESPQISRVQDEPDRNREPAPPQPLQWHTPQVDATHRKTTAAVSYNQSTTQYQPYQNLHTSEQRNTSGDYGSFVPGLNNYVQNSTSNGPSYITSGEQSQSDEPAAMDVEQSSSNAARDGQSFNDDLYADTRPPSPLIRDSEALPVASRLVGPPDFAASTTSSRVGGVGSHAVPVPVAAAPAQVAALRSEPHPLTSPESSPQSGKASDKKKGKKKKRKAGRQVPEVEEVPYIKPEPRSPSPLTAPSYIRPAKRQRHGHEIQDFSAQGAPRYQAPPVAGFSDQQPARQYAEGPTPYVYENGGAYPRRAASVVALGEAPYGTEYVDSRPGQVRHYALPAQPLRHYPQDTRSASHFYVDERNTQPARSYHEPMYPVPRGTVPPEGDFRMPAPRRPEVMPRVYVDSTGREYHDPGPQVLRQSVAPSPRDLEPRYQYDPALPTAVSRQPGVVPYAERPPGAFDGAQSPYIMPRRVVTQPEYPMPAYPEVRERGYSTRPLTQPGDYGQALPPPPPPPLAPAAQDARQVDGAQERYVSRASVRSAEHVQYDIPQSYAGPIRMQSVRPEAPERTYTGGVVPEGSRAEPVQQYLAEYGSHPVQQQMVRREFSARPPASGYYEPRRPGEEVAFFEAPRGATHEIVYADDGRREVYR